MLTALTRHWNILAGDLRHGSRGMMRTPVFLVVALLAIVLGVTATTTVFSLVNAVLIRSLPYGNPERLLYMWTPLPSAPGFGRELSPSFADMLAWQRLSHSFTDITAVQRYAAFLTDGSPQRMGVARVLGNFGRTLEVHPELGRMIDANDDHPGGQAVAVISDHLWRARFGGGLDVLGEIIRLNRRPYRVIGVMASEFAYPHGNDLPGQFQFASLARTDVWVPSAVTPKEAASPDFSFDAVIGRLRPGVSASEAQAEISTIERRLAALHSDGMRDRAVLLVPFIETAVGEVRPLLHLFMGAVFLVLVMVCGNLASLLIARAAQRFHEMGVRTALGAQCARLIRLMLTESLMLSLVGGAVAIPVSYAAVKVVVRLNPGNIPRFEETRLDANVLLFALLVSLGTGFIAGVFPALSAASVNTSELLRRGGRGMPGVSLRARNGLIVAEVALSVILLAGAGLMIRSYTVVQHEDKGFAQSTLTMSIELDPATQNLNVLRRMLMERIQEIPGVLVAGSIDDLPLSTYEDMGFLQVEGFVSNLKETVSVRETGGQYFRAMQIPLVAGRYLKDGDIATDPALWPTTVAVSESFAKHYFPGRSAIGHRLRINGSRWSTIVGVVGDVRHSGLEESPKPIVYLQNGLADSVAMRTIGTPEVLVPSIRRAISAVAPGVVISDIRTMSQYVDQASASRRFQTTLLTCFASIAVFLALVGLFGLLSFAVQQRTAEIGIRMALGASRKTVVWMVVNYALKLTAAGLAIGILIALMLTRMMASLLYGIHVADPVTFVAVPASILVVAAVACIFPAWNAARVDPVNAIARE